MAKSTLELIALSITKSKNPAIYMVSTAKGMFSVRKTALDKRGIQIPDNQAFKFSEPTVVIVEQHQKGDYIFGYDSNGQPIPAPQDSSRIDPTTGEPVYKTGDTPKFDTDGATVRSFVSFQEWKAQHEMNLLMKQIG